MKKLANLLYRNSGELEAAIYQELAPLAIASYYPDLNNEVSGPLRPMEPPLPIPLELPPRRSYGRINAGKDQLWLFRYDTSYAVICTAPVLQRKLDALAVLSDDDIVFSTPKQGAPTLIKFTNHDSLTLAVMVLRQALFDEYQRQ